MISVGYEQARGLRQPGQKGKLFEISVTKTVDASALKLFRAWTDEETRDTWLQKKIVLRKATKPTISLPKRGRGSASGGTIRFTWPGSGAIVVAALYGRGPKTQVSIQHGKLKNSTEAEKMRHWWKAALHRLEQHG